MRRVASSPSRAGRRPHRLIVVQGVLLAAFGAGCGMSNSLDEYVVQFAPGTPPATARAVGTGCPRFGKAILEPADRNHLATSRAYPVRYDVTHASDDDKTALLACLKKSPLVRGYRDTNDDDT